MVRLGAARELLSGAGLLEGAKLDLIALLEARLAVPPHSKLLGRPIRIDEGHSELDRKRPEHGAIAGGREQAGGARGGGADA